MKDPWTIIETPCEGCGHPVRFPRNYPDQRLCVACLEGLLDPVLRPAFRDMLEAFGLPGTMKIERAKTSE